MSSNRLKEQFLVNIANTARRLSSRFYSDVIIGVTSIAYVLATTLGVILTKGVVIVILKVVIDR